MPRTLPVHRALHTVLTQIVNDPRVTVTAEPDVDAYEHLPMVIFAATSDGRIANADLALGESWAVAVSVCAKTNRAAEEIAASVAYFMADLQDHYPVIRDGAQQLCSVAYADVISLPDRAPVTATVAKDVAQYNGSFRVLLTP